ncbi:MAG: class I SAM-dependent methyltransferase [Chloroflexota bacterium]
MTGEPASPFESLADAYDEWFESPEGRCIFLTEVGAFRNLLPLLPQPWLEVGVGSGRFAWELGIEYGVDPSLALLRKGAVRGVQVIRGRGEELALRAETFGTVFFIVTVCFLDRPIEALRESRRVLAADGMLALGLVLSESPWGHFYRDKKMSGHRFYQHATFYSYHELRDLLGCAGFAVTGVVSTLFQPPGHVRSVETPRRGYDPRAGFTVVSATKR